MIDEPAAMLSRSRQTEPLKGEYKGWWSRRISDEHRLVYRVTGVGSAPAIEIAQCRFHYA